MRGAMIHDTAYAKVNLALHVRERRADGYHALETLFAFCADGDAIAVSVRDDGQLTLSIDGPFADELDAGEDYGDSALNCSIPISHLCAAHLSANKSSFR